MFLKSRRFLVVLLLAFLTLAPSGCYLCGWKRVFCFDRTYALASGQEMPLYGEIYYNQYVVPLGFLIFLGQINPPLFSSSKAGFPVPSKLNIIIRHLDTNGSEIEKREFKVRVNKNGKIRKQTFPFAQMSIKADEQVKFSIQPKGDIVPSSLSFTVEYKKQ